jgi:hypothetical protein
MDTSTTLTWLGLRVNDIVLFDLNY